MHKGFSALVLFGFVAVGAASTGCDTYSYPTPVPDKDQMKKNEYVYGDVDGPPRHSKNTYPTNPDAAARALEIKKRLYADDPDLYSRWNAPANDGMVGKPSSTSNKQTAPTVNAASPGNPGTNASPSTNPPASTEATNTKK